MTPSPSRRTGGAAAVVLTLLCLTFAGDAARAASVAPGPGTGATGPSEPRWVWPVTGARVVRPYEAPVHEYAPGHRGVDLDAGSAGVDVRSPDAGVVAFAGWVVDRPVLTIDHGDGLVSTLEPVDATVLPGDRVERGAVVGALATGGHSAPDTLHLGARRDGAYLNPLLLLGALERAVLLPCC